MDCGCLPFTSVSRSGYVACTRLVARCSRKACLCLDDCHPRQSDLNDEMQSTDGGLMHTIWFSSGGGGISGPALVAARIVESDEDNT